jgi:hypothetical protein
MSSFKEKERFAAKAAMLLSVFYLSLSLITLSCTKSTEHANPASSDHNVLWPNSPAQSYIIDQERSCFCPPLGFVRLKVVNDEIIHGIELESHRTLTAEELEPYMTIEELFDFVEIVERAHPAVSKVEYDARFGFPCGIYVDWNRDVLDEQIGITTRLVRLIP